MTEAQGPGPWVVGSQEADWGPVKVDPPPQFLSGFLTLIMNPRDRQTRPGVSRHKKHTFLRERQGHRVAGRGPGALCPWVSHHDPPHTPCQAAGRREKSAHHHTWPFLVGRTRLSAQNAFSSPLAAWQTLTHPTKSCSIITSSGRPPRLLPALGGVSGRGEQTALPLPLPHEATDHLTAHPSLCICYKSPLLSGPFIRASHLQALTWLSFSYPKSRLASC